MIDEKKLIKAFEEDKENIHSHVFNLVCCEEDEEDLMQEIKVIIDAQPKILSPNYFQEKSLQTVDSSNSMLFLQGVLGLNGEAGEVNEALLEYYTSMLDTIKDNLKMWREASKTSDDLKKYLFQGHDLEKKNVALELGDVMWYVAITAHVMGYTLEEIMQMNIEKREVRYGGEFSVDKSVNRKE